MNCCEIIAAIIFPPLAVGMRKGCGIDFCLNLLLTCLFYLPGLIHALMILSQPKPSERDVVVLVQGSSVPQVIVHPGAQEKVGAAPPPYNPEL